MSLPVLLTSKLSKVVPKFLLSTAKDSSIDTVVEPDCDLFLLRELQDVVDIVCTQLSDCRQVVVCNFVSKAAIKEEVAVLSHGSRLYSPSKPTEIFSGGLTSVIVSKAISVIYAGRPATITRHNIKINNKCFRLKSVSAYHIPVHRH